MKKIYSFLLPLLLLAFVGCNDEADWGQENIQEPAPYFIGAKDTLRFSRLGGIEYFQVNTNVGDWTVESNAADWCKVERLAISGTAARVTVSENSGESPRTALITVTSASGTSTVVVEQAKLNPEILMDQPKVVEGAGVIRDVAKDGGRLEVRVFANVEYDVVLPEGCDWITPSLDEETQTVALAFSANSGKDRLAQLQFVSRTDQSFFTEILVSQDGDLPYISTGEKLVESQIYSNICEGDEGSMAGLLDDNADSFFHSIWSNTGGVDKNGNRFSKPAGAHYIVVDLKEATSVFTFNFTTRKQQNNGCPSIVKLYGSNDFDYEGNWLAEGGQLKNAAYNTLAAGAELIVTFNQNMPTGKAEKYVGSNVEVNGVPAVKSSKDFRYLWIEVAEARNYENGGGGTTSSWAMSGLEVVPFRQQAE